MVVVPVDPTDGSIRVYNNSARHTRARRRGYLIKAARRYTRVDVSSRSARHTEVFDTRESQWGPCRSGPDRPRTWSFADFAGSVTIAGVEVGKQIGVIGTSRSASWPAVPDGVRVELPDRVPVRRALRPTVGQPHMPRVRRSRKHGDHEVTARTTTARVYNYAGFNHYVYDASAVILLTSDLASAAAPALVRAG